MNYYEYSMHLDENIVFQLLNENLSNRNFNYAAKIFVQIEKYGVNFQNHNYAHKKNKNNMQNVIGIPSMC